MINLISLLLLLLLLLLFYSPKSVYREIFTNKPILDLF